MSAVPPDGKPTPRLVWREPTAREVEMIGFVRDVVAEQDAEKRVREGILASAEGARKDSRTSGKAVRERILAPAEPVSGSYRSER